MPQSPGQSGSQSRGEGDGPVGTGEHVVREGDCMANIGAKHGFFWETLWNHPENAALKDARKNPNVLLPGDRVFIPEKTVGDESCATEAKHRFRRKGVPCMLRLRILKPPADDVVQPVSPTGEWTYEDPDPDEDLKYEPEPEADAPFALDVDGRQFDGRTDGDGRLEVGIPPEATRGRLRLYPGTEQERVLELDLGGMDPASSPIGAAKRLRNLGFPCGLDTSMTPELSGVLRLFQACMDLEDSGALDAPTQQKLVEQHGS